MVRTRAGWVRSVNATAVLCRPPPLRILMILFPGVERFLGQAIIDSGVDRSDVFLTTKLWPKDYGFASALDAAMASIKRLNTEYLDLVQPLIFDATDLGLIGLNCFKQRNARLNHKLLQSFIRSLTSSYKIRAKKSLFF